METGRDECEHGLLRRSCRICELEAEVASARSRAERAERERDEARAELKAMETRPLEDRFPCCGWCVEIFETADEVREHLKTCEKAPYRALAADRDRLREALEKIGQTADAGWLLDIVNDVL